MIQDVTVDMRRHNASWRQGKDQFNVVDAQHPKVATSRMCVSRDTMYEQLSIHLQLVVAGRRVDIIRLTSCCGGGQASGMDLPWMEILSSVPVLHLMPHWSFVLAGMMLPLLLLVRL